MNDVMADDSCENSQGTVLEDLEIKLLLEAIHKHYGYDFHNYASSSMTRRIKKYMDNASVSKISDLIPMFLYDASAFNDFAENISVVVTEMFRDPDVFMAIREQVIPLLKTYPFIKIWHAGCASGQEVYSMAIMLEEEGLLDRCHIYATDFNNSALDTSRKGIYPDENLSVYEKNYKLAGGNRSFSDYFVAGYNSIKLNNRLSERVVFSNHNLVNDGVFGEMNLIMCRNVLIYFNNVLQDKVLNLINDSLCTRGFLCIGKRENLQFNTINDDLEKVDDNLRIYRKIAP